MGWVVTLLQEGHRRKALFAATLWGTLYDLTINHLPFGIYPLLWIVATIGVETIRSFLFLGKTVELFALTLFFALFIQTGESLYMGHFQLFYEKILLEAVVAVIAFRLTEHLFRKWKFHRMKLRTG
jgi:signal transduction histidine kinase